MIRNFFKGEAAERLPALLRLKWGLWAVCIAGLLFLLVRIYMQFVTPPPAERLLMVRDIPLPGAFAQTSRDPLAPGLATAFDHFDFQALDAANHLLFIAHTGPSPDREQQVNPHFHPETDAKTDGNVLVFDTQQQRVLALLPLPQVAGLVLAPDLHKVFAADSNDNLIYVIDEQTLSTRSIALQDNDSPDALWYDEVDHLVLVSDPGSPANPDQSNVIARANQNETIIDARRERVLGRIELGVDGQWGDDVGHVRYDPETRLAYVTVQQLANPDSPDPKLLPPPGTASLVAFDPRNRRVITRLNLGPHCLTPHGLALDSEAQMAFVACVDSQPSALLRVALSPLRVLSEPPWVVESNPDMLVLDPSLHLLYVAAGAGITLFREQGLNMQWVGNYSFGVSTHTLAVDPTTHELYLPLPRMGGRPVLRIMQYNVAQYP